MPRYRTCSAVPLRIHSHAGTRPKLPEHLEAKMPVNSRMLKAAEKKNMERKKIHKTAISFKGIKETTGENNV